MPPLSTNHGVGLGAAAARLLALGTGVLAGVPELTAAGVLAGLAAGVGTTGFGVGVARFAGSGVFAAGVGDD